MAQIQIADVADEKYLRNQRFLSAKSAVAVVTKAHIHLLVYM
jgi:hypothetical protein